MEINSEKKKIILESTLELVREHGFHGFPMSEVAKRAGVAVGTIYHYFEGKDQLIQELYLYVVELIYQEALKKDDASKSFKERYFTFWNNLVSLYHSKPAILTFFEMYNNSSYYSDETFVREGKFYNWLYMFFEEGLKSGELKSIDKEVLAVLVLGNMHTTAKVKMNRSLRSGKKPIDLDEISKIIWEGIKSKSET
jgi:AcrR family transcriptional regulator